jgi:hypothetical protein
MKVMAMRRVATAPAGSANLFTLATNELVEADMGTSIGV